MRQTPVNLESALSTLREEMPPPELKADVRRALVSPPRRRSSRRILIGLAAIAVALGIGFYPRGTATLAWADALQSSGNAKISHRIERNPKGDVVFEQWQDGAKRAYVIRNRETGKVEVEMRISDTAYFNYFDMPPPANAAPNPNALKCGIMGAVTKPQPADASYDFDMISTLLKQRDTVVVSQKEVDEHHTVYVLRSGIRKPQTMTVDVEKPSGRITRVVSNTGYVDTIEYPASLDPTIFEPSSREVRGIQVFNVSEQEQVIRARLSTPISVKNGVTLHLVLLDSKGNLWVLWTGVPEDGKLSRVFKVPGVRLGRPFAPAAFTTSYAKEPRSGSSPVIGQRLFGMGRAAMTKLGPRATVQVPAKHGLAEFKDVPIFRLRAVYDVAKLLGLSRT